MKFPRFSTVRREEGMSLLLAVLIIASIGFLLATTATLAALGQAQIGFHQTSALELQEGVEGCVEHGLLQLNGNRSYAGEVLVLGRVSCTIEVSSLSTVYTLTVLGNLSGDYQKMIHVEVETAEGFEIIDWIETL